MCSVSMLPLGGGSEPFPLTTSQWSASPQRAKNQQLDKEEQLPGWTDVSLRSAVHVGQKQHALGGVGWLVAAESPAGSDFMLISLLKDSEKLLRTMQTLLQLKRRGAGEKNYKSLSKEHLERIPIESGKTEMGCLGYKKNSSSRSPLCGPGTMLIRAGFVHVTSLNHARNYRRQPLESFPFYRGRYRSQRGKLLAMC